MIELKKKFKNYEMINLVKEGMLVALSNVLVRSTVLVLFLFLSRILSIEEVGYFSIFLATWQFITVIIYEPTRAVILRTLGGLDSCPKSFYKDTTIYSLPFFIMLVALILPTVLLSEYAEEVSNAILLSILFIPFTNLSNFQQAILTALGKYALLNKILLINAIITIILTTFFAVIFSFYGLIVGWCLSSVASFLYGYFAIYKNNLITATELAESPYNDLKNFMSMQVTPLLLNSFISSGAIWLINNLMIWLYNDYTILAVFAVCNQWRMVASIMSNAFATISLPALSKIVRDKQFSELKNYLSKIIKTGMIVNCAIALPLLIFADELLKSYNFYDIKVTIMFSLFVASSFLTIYNSIVGSLFASLNKFWLVFLSNLLWASSLIVALLVLLSFTERHMALGGSFLFAYVTMTIGSYFLSKNLYQSRKAQNF